MSNNKLTSIAPALSLGVGPATFSLATSNLSTLTSPTQPMGASLAPTQSLGASPLTANTLSLSGNTLNALNALNNPNPTLNSLNTPGQTIAGLSPPAQTINNLNTPGSSSQQPFLTSQPLTGMMSLSQNFCFSPQPSQSPVSAANQTPTLGVTLGFPMAAAAALTSNAVSLNTNSIPLNASTIPLNSNSFPLNTGNSISQQLVQSLSMGQQPAICASLPQSLNIPLGQALLGMANTAGATASPFLSPSLSSFPGLQSVIMGSTLMGNTAGQGSPLQTMGALNPQPLSFPLTTGAVVTELPTTSQPSQLALPPIPVSKPQDSTLTSDTIISDTFTSDTQVTLSADKQNESQTSSSQQGSVTQPIVLDAPQDSCDPSTENNEASTLNPTDPPEKVEIHVVEDDCELAPATSEKQADSPETQKEESKTPAVEAQESVPVTEVSPQRLELKTDRESPPAPNPKQQETIIVESTSSEPTEPQVDQQMLQCSESNNTDSEPLPSGSADVDVTKEDDVVVQECIVDESLEVTEEKASDEHAECVEESMEVTTCMEDIKQEVMEIEETDAQQPTELIPASCASPPLSSSPVKVEASSELIPCSDLPAPHNPFPSMNLALPMAPARLGVRRDPTRSLLATVKQEAKEVEEEEEMALPDSTPGGSEDSLDSYYRCHSPSPMASLQLTRADTTTVTTTTAAAYARPRLEDEAHVDVKHIFSADGMIMDMEEPDFVWEDYLQETGATAVPPTAFKHVECSLQSGLTKGMRVEVANKSLPGTYWVASVVLTCGPLLRLRYEGYEEDGSEDFWCDLTACEIRPVGWCAENGVALLPPDGLKNKHDDWTTALQEILKSVSAAPSYLLDKATGTSPIEQLKQGMRLELQDADRPVHVWLARIIENVGGRLYLRVEGMESGVADFWAFYLHELLHPVGWAKKRGYSYVPPKVLTQQGLSEAEIQQILEIALKETEDQNLPSDIFKDQLAIKEHTFKRGMKLESVSPISGNHIGPATVVEIIDNFYFVVEIDDLEAPESEKTRFCCHNATPTIFPIQWTAFKGIKLTVPPGWPRPDFNWTEYLNYCRALAAPDHCFHLDHEDHEFERGMKLEAINPEHPNQICAATITKIAAHLMWVHLDSSERIVASHVEHVGSHNLFPVGWCESNGYQLHPPRRMGLPAGSMRRRVAVVQPEMADGNQAREDDSEGRTYCPKIYFNHKCFSGPHLSKGRIAELPCSVGPGAVTLVMKEVLTKLISVAYKSSRVLREIQLDGPPNRSMNQQILKAKYKSKSYRAVVEICRNTSQLEDYCRQICIKLECCPNLVSPHYVGENCPERCSRLTKTKYTYYYGKKKRKIGRPPGGHTNLENGPQKPTKRRKRRRLGMVSRKSHPGAAEHLKDEEEEEEEEEEEVDDKTSETSDTPTVDSCSSTTAMSRLLNHKPHSTTLSAAASKRLKRKYTHHIPPPSEIRTRGAKLPRYSFERRTHKKILLSPVPSGLRTKPVQSLHISKSAKFRSPSPEPGRLPSSGNPNMARPYSSALSIQVPSTTLTIPSTSATFTLPVAYSPLPLDKNPLHWTVADTVQFIKTTDCAHVAKIFREQEIDGQALLLLSLPTVQEHLDLKLGPAIKLCHEIERVKMAYYTQFDTTLLHDA